MRANIHDGPEHALQSEAGYIDARPLSAGSTKTSCTPRPDHTLGSIAFGLSGGQALPVYPHKPTFSDARRTRIRSISTSPALPYPRGPPQIGVRQDLWARPGCRRISRTNSP